jgi:hypothetical protein
MRLTSSSRTVTLPNYAREGLQELITPNAAKNVTLGGTLFVDFFNQRGGWKITFDAITAAEYAELRQVYDDQFTNEEFLSFDRTGLSGDIEPVFMSMPPERSIVWNQEAVLGLQITLEPEHANS